MGELMGRGRSRSMLFVTKAGIVGVGPFKMESSPSLLGSCPFALPKEDPCTKGQFGSKNNGFIPHLLLFPPSQHRSTW